MTRAHLRSVLLEDDGPLLVVFRDVLDGSWLGMAHRQGEDGDEYLCAPVSVRRLAAFQRGSVDLRSVFTELEAGSLMSAFVPSAQSALDGVDLSPLDAVAPEWLPDAGFLFTTFRVPSSADSVAVLADALERKRTILHLNLDPAEAKEHLIDANTLAEALSLFQNTVKQSYYLWRRTAENAVKKAKATIDDFTFQAYAFGHGSFEVHLQAKHPGDFWGYAPQVEALRKLDEIMSLVEKPEEAVAVAFKYRGHYVSSVRALLKFVSTNHVPLTYTWTEPSTAIVVRNVIQPGPAEKLYAELSKSEELSEQEVTYVGKFRDLRHQGRWSMETTDGELISGELVAGADFVLDGVTYNKGIYEIDCREVNDQVVISGAQKRTVILLKAPREVKA